MRAAKFLLLLSSLGPLWSEPGELSLRQVLELAEKNSPGLSASKFREVAAERGVGIARSGYLPTLEWDEMDSSRFPESGRTLGIGGLIGSPYRSGRISVAVAKQTLWDFGRTSYGVEAAKREAQLRREDTKVTLYQIKQAALLAYYDCSRYRSQKETWEALGREIQLVGKEVNRFVKTGQTSVVARYLVDSQIEETETAEADFSARLEAAKKRLAVLTGLTAEDVVCPGLPERDAEDLHLATGTTVSPLVSRAMADAQAAHARVGQAKSGYYPKILGAASAGSLDTAGSSDKGAYAFAAGVALPLFDGLRTENEVRRARAVAAEKDKELEAAAQRLGEIDSQYDEIIVSAQARLVHLEHELKLAEEGFSIAKKRYLSLQGDVVDLREALRNLTRARTQRNDSRTELLQAAGAKALVDGAL